MAIVVHHTATPPYTTWQTIAEYHVNTNGWSGIGYHTGVDADGNISLLGDLDSQRAHVAKRNHELVSISLIGNFTDGEPPLLQQHGLLDAIAWLRAVYGDIPVLGHREAALLSDPTSCPGNALFAILNQFR